MRCLQRLAKVDLKLFFILLVVFGIGIVGLIVKNFEKSDDRHTAQHTADKLACIDQYLRQKAVAYPAFFTSCQQQQAADRSSSLRNQIY